MHKHMHFIPTSVQKPEFKNELVGSNCCVKACAQSGWSPSRLKHVLTNSGDDGNGKIKGAGELPLRGGSVRGSLQHHLLHLPVIALAEAVLHLQLLQLLLQLLRLRALAVRLQRVEHGGSDEEVKNGGEDETEAPEVLLFHPREGRARRRDDRGPQLLLLLLLRGRESIHTLVISCSPAWCYSGEIVSWMASLAGGKVPHLCARRSSELRSSQPLSTGCLSAARGAFITTATCSPST